MKPTERAKLEQIRRRLEGARTMEMSHPVSALLAVIWDELDSLLRSDEGEPSDQLERLYDLYPTVVAAAIKEMPLATRLALLRAYDEQEARPNGPEPTMVHLDEVMVMDRETWRRGAQIEQDDDYVVHTWSASSRGRPRTVGQHPSKLVWVNDEVDLVDRSLREDFTGDQ